MGTSLTSHSILFSRALRVRQSLIVSEVKYAQTLSLYLSIYPLLFVKQEYYPYTIPSVILSLKLPLHRH